MEMALRSIDLSKVILDVTFTKQIDLHGHMVCIIKLNNADHLIVVHSEETVEPLSRHRLKSVVRIRNRQRLALLLQIGCGKHIIWEKIDISDDIFQEINRGNYWIERNASNRLMLVEDTLRNNLPEIPRKRRRRCMDSAESEDELLS